MKLICESSSAIYLLKPILRIIVTGMSNISIVSYSHVCIVSLPLKPQVYWFNNSWSKIPITCDNPAYCNLVTFIHFQVALHTGFCYVLTIFLSDTSLESALIEICTVVISLHVLNCHLAVLLQISNITVLFTETCARITSGGLIHVLSLQEKWLDILSVDCIY